MKENAHIAGIGCAEFVTAGRGATAQDAAERLNWQELAERRLAKLIDIEHEATIARDRLDRLQADYCALALQHEEQRRSAVMLTRRGDALTKQGDEQQRRIGELEHELAQMLASRSWRWTVPIRSFTTCLRRVKTAVSSIFVPASG